MGIMDKAKQVGQLNEMRKQAQKMQKALEEEVLEHSYAGGAIKIVVRGDQKIQSIAIDPDWMANQPHDKLEFGLKDAINQAMFEVQKLAMKKLQSMGGGLGLPGM